MRKFKLVENVIWGGSLLLILGILLVGCGDADESGKPDGLTKVILQTDWFPQPEHGGFYQALAKGYYEEAGLEVVILPGGPNSMGTQKILKGTAHFAMNRADTIFSLVSRDVPILMVMATLQHDPQAILLHQSNPINRLEELDGQRVMAIPGLSWIRWIEAKYSIKLNIIPHDFGIDRFLNDPTFIQQCLLTNETFYVRQAGASPKVLPLRDSGFDPYHGIYCLEALTKDQPELVSAFVAASVRGWQDFILNDPSPALGLIAGRNPKMNPEFMAFCYQALKEGKLVTGKSSHKGELIGSLDPTRMESLSKELLGMGIVDDSRIHSDSWYSNAFLPKPADEPEHEHP